MRDSVNCIDAKAGREDSNNQPQHGYAWQHDVNGGSEGNKRDKVAKL